MITRASILASLLFCAACRTSSLGGCNTDAECPASATCDPAAKVCVVAVAKTCSPACDSTHVCDTATLTCIPTATGTAVISLQTDGRTALFGVGQTATITATVTGTSIVSVNLEIAGQPAFAGVSGSAGLYTFTVPIDATFAPAGTTTAVAFSIVVVDSTGQARLTGDAREVIRVDRDAPQITAITVVTAPDFTGAHPFFKGTGAALSVTANIADGAGVAAGSVCLRIAGETGTCAHAGTAGANGAFSFSLPRPASGFDGTALSFTISANDSLTASLPAADQAEHEAVSAAQQVFFDDTAPAIVITPDTGIFARTQIDGGPDFIPVTAQITDGTSVLSPLLNGTVAPSNTSGNTFTFQLDPTAVAVGTEAALTFHVTAKDALGNSASVAGTRNVDGAGPVAALKVFQGATEPADGGVTYPPAVANTGHDGNEFIYSDVVHVKGTLTDESGIGPSALHIDGIALDGSVSAGVTRPLTCTAGAKTCSFDVQVALNDAQNGAFHTGLTTAAVPAGTLVPFGALQVVIDARDGALQPDGGVSANAGKVSLAANTTRLLWFLTLNTATNAGVSGLAIHPDGDLIATTDAGTATVYDLAPDSPTQRWSFNAGAVHGPPAVGSGAAATAPIYVVAQPGDIFALAPDGGTAGHATTANPVVTGPAVASATFPPGVGAADEVLVSDNVAGNAKVWSVEFDGGVGGVGAFFDKVSSAAADRTLDDAPMVFSGQVWIGTRRGVDVHTVSVTGTLGGSNVLAGTTAAGCCEFFGPITDGTEAYASSAGLSQILAFTSARVSDRFATTITGPTAMPTFGIDGQLYTSDASNHVLAISAVTGAATTVITDPTGNFKVPLHGSDGHIYLPRFQGFLYALENGLTSWTFDPPGTIYRGGLIDCSGRLFVASGATVYAFVSDDHGLADTPWPSLRRDSRNTGNQGALKYGIRTTTGCTP